MVCSQGEHTKQELVISIYGFRGVEEKLADNFPEFFLRSKSQFTRKTASRRHRKQPGSPRCRASSRRRRTSEPGREQLSCSLFLPTSDGTSLSPHPDSQAFLRSLRLRRGGHAVPRSGRDR